MSKPITTVAAHTHIKGDLRFDGPAVIAGHVQGNITSADTLEIAADAIIEGNIQGLLVTVLGTVKGNITAALSCRLTASARVAGNFCTANLAIADGARYFGQVSIGDDLPIDQPTSEYVKEAPAIQVVEATINRIEHAAAAAAVRYQEESESLQPATISFPTMSSVEVLSQTAQSNLQRAPRIIKAR